MFGIHSMSTLYVMTREKREVYQKWYAFLFFFAQKAANVHNGVKNAFIYCVFRAK